MKKLLLGAIALIALGGVLAAQVNTVPQVGVIQAFNTAKSTYSSSTLALPPAASATDVACIAGSASRTVKIREISASGSAGTLVTVPVYLARRAAANTAGTAATTTANWANNISSNDTANATAAATLISYSANPTITDSAPTYPRAGNLTIPVTSAGVATVPLVWRFGDGLFEQPLTLRGAAQQVCLNLGGVSVSSGLLSLSIQWTEE